ncbi:MAG: 4-alpha-glucanotransferase [candidate division WOR-3 bacterium]|nr:MAG: 4-alpha-glucanotransferase [candidate division WOR-3 bacterium]
MGKRGSGILLHVTSLPSRFGIGDLGPGAYRFADFLIKSKQRYWQVLPLTPVDYPHEQSPYNCMSAFAFNKYLISPELMVRDGQLKNADLDALPRFSQRKANFAAVFRFKDRLFERAYERFKSNRERPDDYLRFCEENSSWLDDYALFIALRESQERRSWIQWPAKIKDRDAKALESLRKTLKRTMEREEFLQYVFWKQWVALKSYCNDAGMNIIGDVPIYVDFNSVDVWSHRRIFKLNKDSRPLFVSGVPPDYFSETGQLWGNPVYDWHALRRTGFEWWIQRIAHSLKIFDCARLDHFRGFVAFWQVRSAAKTAKSGKWVKVPVDGFLSILRKKLRRIPIIAEDLGTITPDVREVMWRHNIPGMKVMLFAFGDGGSANPYLVHNHVRNCVVYTGTHDNNTVRGWFMNEASKAEKQRLFAYLGRRVSAQVVHEEVIRLAMSSVADTTIIPMQDILGLGSSARMNCPAGQRDNWQWRLLPGHLRPSVAEWLARTTVTYGRA